MVEKVIRKGVLTGVLLLGAMSLLPTIASAQPTISVGAWDYNLQTVTYVYQNLATGGYTWQLEDYVKDTLPGEWGPSWSSEALISGALLIRSGAYYDVLNPESNYVSNSSGHPFNLRDTTRVGPRSRK